MAKPSRHMARLAAVQALYQWQLTEQAPADIETHFISDHELKGVDIEYFHHLVREVPLHQHELDDHLTPHLGRTIDEVDPVERAILRIGAFELEFQLEIPYKAVINEAVELAKSYGGTDGYKYVNGVLVASQQENAALDRAQAGKSAVEVRCNDLLQPGRGRDGALEEDPEILRIGLVEALRLGELRGDGPGIGSRQLPLVHALQRELAGAAAAGFRL
jgi:N utilization substance protein B